MYSVSIQICYSRYHILCDQSYGNLEIQWLLNGIFGYLGLRSVNTFAWHNICVNQIFSRWYLMDHKNLLSLFIRLKTETRYNIISFIFCSTHITYWRSLLLTSLPMNTHINGYTLSPTLHGFFHFHISSGWLGSGIHNASTNTQIYTFLLYEQNTPLNS